MKTEYKIFGIVAVFLFGRRVVYAFWTNGEPGHVDWIGTVALSCRACCRCAAGTSGSSRGASTRARRTAGRRDRRGRRRDRLLQPGQLLAVRSGAGRRDRRPGPGVLDWWLIALGLIVVIFGACGLLFEYYSGTRRTAEH